MTFPVAPANNQVYERPDGTRFRWRTVTKSWLRVSSSKPPTTQRITATGASAITIPAGAVKVRVTGSGGGGAGGNNNGVSWGHASAGGGSGYAGEALIDLAGATSMDVIVGAGGVGTTSSAGDGGDTTVNIGGLGSIIFGGGKAASYTPADPAGGFMGAPGGAGGTLGGTLGGQVVGGSDPGGPGLNTSLPGTLASGNGGSTAYGAGGQSQGSADGSAAPASPAGRDGSGYGGGGSGSVNRNTFTTAAKGGNGAPGFVNLEWIF